MRENQRASVTVLIVAVLCLTVILFLRYMDRDKYIDGLDGVDGVDGVDSTLSEDQTTDDPNVTEEPETTAPVSTYDPDNPPVVAPVPTSMPPPSEEPLPQISLDAWELILVNNTHSIGTYIPQLTELEGGHYFDSRAVSALQSFLDAARDEGLSVMLSSAYRSADAQRYLYERKVKQYGGDEATAATIVPPAGYSEHQTGLCADITDRYYETKTEALENTALYKWMLEHCQEYGFILRYPKDKTEITGIIYEPWHFRYVGKEVATYIMSHDLTLEEFLDLYSD